jgi:hypothetical protein
MAIRDDFTAGEVLAAADLNDTFAAKLDLAGGKVLQVVRATDATNRSTTSGTYVDASISVTITPQKSTSAILLIWTLIAFSATAGTYFRARITDNSNNGISGADQTTFGSGTTNSQTGLTLIGYSTPATTSATTYKGRFLATAANTVQIINAEQTGQLYAIEVSA